MLEDDAASYKMMTNIITESRHRTRYVKALKNFTIDAQVSYERIVISICALILVVLFAGGVLLNAGREFPYIALPVIGLAVALVTIIVIYTISSRNRSLLTSVLDLIMFTANEKLRRASGGLFRSVGIESIDDGTITFTNGDKGALFKVEGQLNYSVLPAIANMTAEYRQRYLIARAATTQEQFITYVTRVDAGKTLEHLVEKQREHDKAGDANARWSSQYLQMMHDYIDVNIHDTETRVSQLLIVRDITDTDLSRAIATMVASCSNNQVFSRCDRVVDDREIMRLLNFMTNADINAAPGQPALTAAK